MSFDLRCRVRIEKGSYVDGEQYTGFGPSCADCGSGACADGSGSYPPFCRTASLAEGDREALLEEYRDEDTRCLMVAASDTARLAFDEHWCRVEETMDFAHRIGVCKIGVAMCSGLLHEGRTLARVLRANGFDVYGAACKAGSLKRSELGVADSCCDFGAVSCDPLLQARMLNEAGTELNVVVGLCVGHDILFSQRSVAPCTTLVVKDRALVHNPVAALHAVDGPSPYSRMLKQRPTWRA